MTNRKLTNQRLYACVLTTVLLAACLLAGAGSASAQVISGVTATNVTDHSAVITWVTDRPASTLVNYGASYGHSSGLNPVPVTMHSVTLDGLTANTLYDFKVVSGAATGHTAISSNFRFATLSAAPVIGDINVINVTSTSATVNWTTDQPSTGMVHYGTSPGYASTTPVISTPSIAHTVTLTGLTPSTTYHFSSVSVGSMGVQSASTNETFATPDPNTTAPSVDSVASFGVTNSTAMISWTTDVPANTVLAYGTTPALGQFTTVQEELSANHGVTLTGLNPGTTYYFAAISTTAGGASGYSTPASVTTTGAVAAGPAISNVASSNLTATAATITWTTDVPSSSLVNYGTTASYGLSITDPTLTRSHSVTLTGLAAGTRYVFQVVSASAGGVSSLGADLSAFTIWAWGDSQTSGGNDGSGINYPSSLAANLNAPVSNQGVGGDSGAQIAQRMLATPAAFRVGNCSVFWSNHGASQVSEIPPEIARMVAALDTPKCFLVLSIINHVDPIGSSIYNSVIAANTGLAAQYGTNYLDIRKLLVDAYNPALPLDVADHAADIMPASLRAVQRKGTITSGFLDGASCQFSVSSGTQGPGTVLIIDSETILINSMSSTVNITGCVRGYNGTAAASHAANSGYSTIDGVHVGGSGLNFVASQVAAWFRSQPWPLCAGTPGLICPAPLNFTTVASNVANPLIAGVAASNVTSTTAVINWTTDQPANAQVNYGTTSSYGTTTTRTTALVTGQAVALTGLTPSTTYNYRVISANSSGGSTTSANYTFTTPSASATPPAVAYVAFWGVNNNGVTISWSTDVNSSTVVAYGTSTALGQIYTNTSAGSTSTANHGAVLTGLAPGTKYYFVAQSTGANGATGYSTTFSFTTTGTAASPSFTLSATTAAVSVGSTGTSTVTVSPLNGFNAAVTLAASGWPAGITGTFASSLATISVGSGVAPGSYALAVIGNSGTLSANTAISLTVAAVSSPSFTLSATAAAVSVGSTGTSTVTVSPLNGFNAAVTLAASGWPAGITGTFGSSLATISVGAGVAPGSYSLAVTGTSGTLSANTAISLTVVSPPNFTLSATTAAVSVGSTGTSTVTVSPLNGFNAAVTLAASGWPAGITGTFGSSIVTISVGSGVAPGSYALTVTGTSGALSKTTTIALTVTSAVSAATYANFTGLDTSTQGTWSGTYGSDGFLIANGASNLPPYASASFSGALTYTWAGLTSDLRALQSSRGSTARIASSYYASTSAGFNINLNLTDGAAHQVAIYLLDWDTTTRAQTIAITDSATGALLDTRSFSGFHNGAYGIWNIKGAVTLKVTAAAGGPVASAIFLAPANGATAPPPSFTLNALAATANPGSAGTSTVTIAPANGFNSAVTLASVNWPAGITGTFGTNPATGSSGVAISVGASVAPGAYTLNVTGTSGALSASTAIALAVNAVSSGGGGPSASFAGQDTATGGTWTSTYGAAGYAIANGSSAQAPYATVGFRDALTYTWAAQTTDTRALLSSRGAATRIASAYTQYGGQAFTINIGIADGNTHSISLYLLDWDGASRSQTITVLDAVSNAVLDTRTFSGFRDGLYASWNIKGNVTIRVSPSGYSSPVVGGVFLN